MSNLILDNIANVEQRIQLACKQSSRERNSVRLVAVSKTFTVELIRVALGTGLLEFGENYIPEGSLKAKEIKKDRPDAKFHFIGHLQRNKVREVVSCFDLIHTVDRIELANEIDKQANKLDKVMPVLIQVNISSQESKSGCRPEELKVLAESISKLKHLALSGIMSIGSALELNMADKANYQIVENEFKAMRTFKLELEQHLGFTLAELSMGMSSDLELAIAHGSTIVRVGTSIFGSR